MIAFQVGFREAARQCEVEEQTVLKWAEREGWMAQKEQVLQAQALKVENQGLSSVVSKSPAEMLLSYKYPSKIAQAKAVCKTAKGFSRLDPETLMKKTSEVLNNVSAGNKLWPEEQSTVNQTLVNINLLQADYGESPK